MQEVEAGPALDRPLWRRIVDFPLVAMLVAVGLVVAGLTAAALITKLAVPAVPGFTSQMVFDVVGVVILILVYKLAIRHLGEHPRDDLRASGALRLLAAGLLGGFAVFSAIVGVAAALGVYDIVGRGDLTGLLRALVMFAIFPAVSEELLFRGILFRWIEEFAGSWVAILLTSAFFGAAHLMNPNASPIAAVGIAFEAGVMLGGAYMLTRSLWLPMGLHAAWNFTQGAIYDIPVSGTEVNGIVDARLCCNPLLTGGGFGLEASLIAMVVATLFGLWLLWMAIRKGELVKPWWVRRRVEQQPA